MSPTNNRRVLYSIVLTFCALLTYAGGLIHGRYLGHGWPLTLFAEMSGKVATEAASDPHAGHDHGEDAHDHAGHSEENSLELTDTARKNLGLTEEYLQPIELASFDRTLSVPAIVVDRPGRTRLPVSSATTGIVTHVHAVSGEAVFPGDLLIEMRLTHEDLVTAQKEFLQALGDRDVEAKEIARLESVASSGAVSNKTLLERQYSRDKIDSLLRSQREALRLHGISETQIQTIESQRRLLTELKIYVPDPDDHSAHELRLSRQNRANLSQKTNGSDNGEPNSTPSFQFISNEIGQIRGQNSEPSEVKDADHPRHLLILQDLHVQKGQAVNAGDLVCTLAEFNELLIEGQAFETEASQLTRAKKQEWTVAALVEEDGKQVKLPNLTLAWLDNEVDPVSRAFKFYANLNNEIAQESVGADKKRHVAWRFRPGQRMQLLIPVEKWEEQIVLPVDAVVREGIESYVFQQNGDHYDRVAVHERFRDQTSVVIENDGNLFPGDVVALRGAHQLQMALKNKAGGAVDPHAGHNH